MPTERTIRPSVGCKQLARSGEARHQQPTGCEIGSVQWYRPRITVGAARDLTENPVTTVRVGETNRRADLRLR